MCMAWLEIFLQGIILYVQQAGDECGNKEKRNPESLATAIKLSSEKSG